MKSVTVIGARPQFVKAAALSKELSARPQIEEIIIDTGQHYDANMAGIFFEELKIPKPKYNLGIGSGSHGAQTGRALISIEEILLKEKPDVVIVYGDTNATLSGALAAAKLHIPIAHIEAGLRSFNRKMPEEINRVLTDHLSKFLFTPGDTASSNLTKEGIAADSIFQVGDIMFDSVNLFSDLARKQSKILDRLELKSKAFILSTLHRAENVDSPSRLKNLLSQLNLIAKEMLPVVLPLHPRTKKMMVELSDGNWDHVKFTEPCGYLDMLKLVESAQIVATDSGGLQKEAFFLKTPTVVCRSETEWVELDDLGWSRLANPDSSRDLLDQTETHLKAKIWQVAPSRQPYGDGRSALKIKEILEGALR